MGKSIIDKKEAIRMLEQGMSQAEVARHFGVTYQAIQLHVKNAKENGQLKDYQPRRGRISKRAKQVRLSPKEKTATLDIDPIDALVGLILDGQKYRREMPALKAELAKYQRAYENMRQYAHGLEEGDKKRKDQALVVKVAMQQGELPNLPEHIDYTNPFLCPAVYINPNHPYFMPETIAPYDQISFDPKWDILIPFCNVNDIKS